MKRALLIAALLQVSAFAASAEEGFRPIFNPPAARFEQALASDADRFSILIGLLRTADLPELNAKSDKNQAFTLLAVPDQGFAGYSKPQLARLTGDKSMAQAFLRRHLLTGKVVFAQLFDGPMAKPGSTPLLKTAVADDGHRVSILCNDHPAQAGQLHFPLIEGRAKVLTPDIQGDRGVIQVIDRPVVAP